MSGLRAPLALIAALACGACAGTRPRADETPATPPLVRVTDQVWVVAELERPVFFCGGSFWLYAPDGAWFQSNEFDGDYAPVSSYSVPQPLAELPDPGRFAYAVGSLVNGAQGLVTSQVGTSPPTPDGAYATGVH